MTDTNQLAPQAPRQPAMGSSSAAQLSYTTTSLNEEGKYALAHN